MRIDWNSAPPGAITRPAAPRPPDVGSSEPVEPQDTAWLSGANPAAESPSHSAKSLAARAGTVALAVTASIAGLSGLAHAFVPALAAAPPVENVPSISVVVEAPTQVRPSLFTQAPAVQATTPTAPVVLHQEVQVASASTATATKVPDSVKQLTPEFFKRLGDVNYNYKKIAKGQFVLTFDDGPNPKVTPQILDTLKEHHIKGAVFFVTGENAQRYPDLLKRIVAEGHVLGDHTWTHADLTKISQTKVLSELNRTDAAVDKALGYDYPLKLVRPPYGAQNSTVLSTIHTKYGGNSMTWQVDSEDWKVQSDLRQGKKTTPLTTRVVNGVKAMDKQGHGGVILMHDIHSNTAKDLDKVLDTLESKGYKLIPITDVGKAK